MRPALLTPLVAAGALLSAGSAAAQSDTVIPGDSPAYSFRTAYNAMGAVGNEDFLGKPVLVEFWGTK